MKKTIAKTWEPKEFEGKLYSDWEKAGYFKPEFSRATTPTDFIHRKDTEKEPFCIIMPPPNANGSLHLGHAVFVTLEDIMIRYVRLQGKAALWLPGADHAGFETQVVFEKKLEKEGKNRFQIPRDELYQMMLDFTLENKKLMESQLRSLGASCDWSREKFTLDPEIVKIVYQTFKKLYEDGLAYRALRLVNWCPKHMTSLSDLEVEYEERQSCLYYLKYGPITVATTRPETMFGDAAVAVNPEDKRYKDLIGKKILLPLTGREIPVIADEAVDIKFGTGAVKVTPAHDATDFEIGQRHKLEVIQVIDDRSRILPDPRAEIEKEFSGKIGGIKVAEARGIIIKELENRGLVEKINDKYNHIVGVCYKCKNTIEPLPKEQWFISVSKAGKKTGKELASDALKAVKSGQVKFVTKRFEKIVTRWFENIRDWNVSRQIVWGIRIPAWYKNEEIYVGEEPPKGEGWEQDPDVFDTWFSSGQWPFAALLAQNGSISNIKDQKSKIRNDFEKFYPTSVMETAWDILFFWVARMIMLGLYATDEVPFKNVYIHGLVRDKDRQKMSKSKGNVIDPLGVAEMYGTDAVRLALVFGTGAGNDVIVSEEKIRGMRNFTNKIWNASRYVILKASEGDLKEGALGEEKLADLNIDEKILTDADKEIIRKHKEMIRGVSEKLDKYQFSQAGEELYDYFWHNFCDKYIEAAKKQFQGVIASETKQSNSRTRDDKKIAAASGLAMTKNEVSDNTKKVLTKILSESLTMLHPFIPFVTEAVWQELRVIYPDLDESIVITNWPSPH